MLCRRNNNYVRLITLLWIDFVTTFGDIKCLDNLYPRTRTERALEIDFKFSYRVRSYRSDSLKLLDLVLVSNTQIISARAFKMKAHQRQSVEIWNHKNYIFVPKIIFLENKMSWNRIEITDYARLSANPLRKLAFGKSVEPNPGKRPITFFFGDPTVYGNFPTYPGVEFHAISVLSTNVPILDHRQRSSRLVEGSLWRNLQRDLQDLWAEFNGPRSTAGYFTQNPEKVPWCHDGKNCGEFELSCGWI